MKRLMILVALAACVAACGSPAAAQNRDRDSIRFQGRGFRHFSDRDWEQLRRERRARTYVFGQRAHLSSLASELYEQANSICWEMHRYYRHNRDYDVTYREMYEIRKAAKHVETLVKENYYRRKHSDDHIIRDLHEMDKWFHHVQRDVRRWRPSSPRAYRGGDLKESMDEFHETLVQLMEDYGVKSKIETASSGRGRNRR